MNQRVYKIRGKLLSERPADFEAVRNVMAALWRPGKGVFVKELDINRYLFQFFHEVDIQRVIEGAPWTFNKIPLIIERLRQGENPRTLSLNTLEIWVQVYDLKVGFMSEKVLKAAGDYIGTFVSSCTKNFTGIWRDYLRVRVRVNIDKPLKRRMKIYRNKEEWFWANFKYERIPTFCFICGVIGHSEKFCHKLFDEPLDTIVKPYGLFMKAPDRRNNKQIGARWLKDNMAQPLAGNFGANETGSDDRRMQNSDPRITDTVMIDGGNQGGVDGGTGGNKGKSVIMSEKSGESGSLARIVSGSYYSNLEEEVTIIENKRKRVQSEELLGQSIVGQPLLIKSVDHLNEDKEADKILELDQNNEITDGSKNGLPAGFLFGARQEL